MSQGSNSIKLLTPSPEPNCSEVFRLNENPKPLSSPLFSRRRKVNPAFIMASESFAATAAPAAMATANAARAVKALLKLREAQSATQKPQLLPRDDFIYLNLTLKKIPQKPPTKPFKILLPHPLMDSSAEICLIIDDRPTSNLTKETAQKIIKSQNIVISKVIRMSKLKTNYKPFEAKRKLCDSFDLFLVDRRIVHFLPKLLGKSFFKKKKLPLPLDLTHKNWKEQIERAVGCGLLYMRTGTCCVMKVGKVSMGSEEIVANVVEAIKGALELLPKKWVGVRSLHLKFSDSLALPLYQALPDVKFRIEGAKDSLQSSDVVVQVKEDSLGEEKKGEKKGKKKKKKGRIHEVRYMDIGGGEAELESEDDEEENEGRNSEDALCARLWGDDENERNKNEDDDGCDKSGSNKKVVKHLKREGKKKRLSSEGAKKSIKRKLNKPGKELKEASSAKKSKRGKTEVSPATAM